MELPHLGKQCSMKSCKRLDFLPIKCDACHETFCSEHYSYLRHNCQKCQSKNVQVPVCPMCQEPIPTAPGVSPDVTVGNHIDGNCKSQKTKIFNYKCSFKSCKKKELIPVQCDKCKQNYCLTHRHFKDHECQGPPASTASSQSRVHRSTSTAINSVQGTMSEDEALARAMALSIQEYDDQQSRALNRPTVTSGGRSKDGCRLA